MVVVACRPSALPLVTANLRPHLIQRCHFSLKPDVHTKAPKRPLILLNAVMNISDQRWRRWLGMCERDVDPDSGALALSLTSFIDEYQCQLTEGTDGKPQSPNRIDDDMRERRRLQWSLDIDRWLFFNKNGRPLEDDEDRVDNDDVPKLDQPVQEAQTVQL